MRASLERWVHAQWARRGVIPCLLYPASLAYGAVSRWKSGRQVPVRLPVPVIVVGNIYVGGTGKTPITIELARSLRGAGFRPGIISRGYRSAETVQEVTAQSLASEVGDEPLLIYRLSRIPVAVGADRPAAGRLLLEKHPEINVIISDDGLQHTRLARDMELAVVGARGIGNGWILPAGPLRDPPCRLDTVDAVIMNATRDTFASRTPRFAATSQLGKSTQLSTGKFMDIDELSAKIAAGNASVLAAAGIAAPGRFFAMLRAHDIECTGVGLGDHYGFTSNPFASSRADYILITGKDAVKCAQNPEIAADSRIWVVDLEMHLEPYLLELVLEKLLSAGTELRYSKNRVPHDANLQPLRKN